MKIIFLLTIFLILYLYKTNRLKTIFLMVLKKLKTFFKKK